MERTKPVSEESQPEKKRKKKQSGSEKAGRAKQVLKAPVPLEIIAEEEKAKKEKKSKSKIKKAKKETAVPAKEQENNVLSQEQAAAKPRQNKAAASTEKAPEATETHSLEALPKKTKATEHETSEELFFSDEEIIWSQESGDEPEGELWGRKKPRVEPSEVVSDSENIIEDEDTSVGDSTTATTAKSTQKTRVQSSGVSAAQPASKSPASGQARGRGQTTTHTAAGGGGQMPPHAPTAAGEAFNSGPAAANTAPLQPSTPAAANQAPYRNFNAERRNLVAGILLGGIIEHIRHKRREKRIKATHEKEIKKIKDEQQFQQAEQRKDNQKAAREKTNLEARLERLSQVKQSETELASKRAVTTETIPSPIAVTEQQKEKSPVAPTAEAQSNFYEDFKRKYRTPEVAATARTARQEIDKKDQEKPAPVPKQQPENIDEPLQVSPDRRVESSAWHRIEVDKKTGKAVENPELAYGDEFQKEQHQEQLRQQIAEASMESERVKQNYMPMIDKTSSTSVETHDPPHRKATPQKPHNNTMLAETLQNLKDKAADSNGIDIALWIVLFIVIIAIIALL